MDLEPSNVCPAPPQLPESTGVLAKKYSTIELPKSSLAAWTVTEQIQMVLMEARGHKAKRNNQPTAPKLVEFTKSGTKVQLCTKTEWSSLLEGGDGPWPLAVIACRDHHGSPTPKHTCQGSHHGRTGKSRWRMNASERPVSRTISNVLTSCEVDGSLAKLPSHFLRVQPYV